MGILKKLLKLISNQITVTVIAMALQFFWWFFLVLYLTDNNVYLNIIMWIVAFVIVIWVINRRINPSYKLIWAILILSMPIVGLIFWFVGRKVSYGAYFQRDLRRVIEEHGDIMPEDPEVGGRLREADRRIANQSRYLTNTTHMPVYQHTVTEYFSVGEDWFARYVEELKKAKHYIFLEYFILEEGYMWDTVLNILQEKAREGVDVRLIYDSVDA